MLTFVEADWRKLLVEAREIEYAITIISLTLIFHQSQQEIVLLLVLVVLTVTAVTAMMVEMLMGYIYLVQIII